MEKCGASRSFGFIYIYRWLLLCHVEFYIYWHVTLIFVLKKSKIKSIYSFLPLFDLTLSLSVCFSSITKAHHSLSSFDTACHRRMVSKTKALCYFLSWPTFSLSKPGWNHNARAWMPCHRHCYSPQLATSITVVVSKPRSSFAASCSLTLTRFLSSIYQI